MVLAGVLGISTLIAGPIVCLSAIFLLVFSGLNPEIAQLGPLNVQLVDVLYVLLTMMLMPRLLRVPRSRLLSPVAGCIIFVGLTLIPTALLQPDYFETAFVSWLRLAQTLSLMWFVLVTLESVRHVQILIGSIIVSAVYGVTAALIEAIQGAGLLESRYAGSLNYNHHGLLSCYLILFALFALPPSNRLLRPTLVTVGLMGLALDKSIASIVALIVGYGIGHLLHQGRRGVSLDRRVRAWLTAIAAGLIGLLLISVTRPEMLPGSDDFFSSSTSHRLVLGAAGVRIFLNNPVMGVGWQQSSRRRIIGDPELSRELQEQYPEFPPGLLPAAVPTTVHNAYVQLLAEFGLLGVCAFFFLFSRLRRDIRAILVDLTAHPDLTRLGFTATAALIATGVWLNDNPIFGGLMETYALALLLGLLSALHDLIPRTNAQIANSTPGELLGRQFSRSKMNVWEEGDPGGREIRIHLR
jgi:O-antigen ligase